MHAGEDLTQIRELLEEIPPSNASLKAAARLFWRAYFWADSWTPEARQDAEVIIEAILAEGTIDRTVEESDDETLSEVSRLLLNFCTRHGSPSADA